jgi:apolipoprotein N-acyltransferase
MRRVSNPEQSCRLVKTYYSRLEVIVARLLVREAREVGMLWTIFVILLILWLLGFSFHVGGALIHLLIVLAVIVLVFNLLRGRRGTA